MNRKLDSSAPSANRKHRVDTAGVDVGLAPILHFELNGRRGKPNLTKPDGFEIAAIVLRYLGITFDKPLIVDKLANPPPNLQKMSDRRHPPDGRITMSMGRPRSSAATLAGNRKSIDDARNPVAIRIAEVQTVSE